MSHTIRSTALAAVVALTVSGAAPAAASDWFGVSVSNHGVSLGLGGNSWGIWGSSWDSAGWSVSFEAELSGHGEWVHVGGLGRVWRPWVAADWRPYRYGRWVWTTAGWTWVAYEPWGWIPHHYGNWAMTTVGWVWSPGYVYHPGNVVWVRSGGYVGWYPCSPRGWSHWHRGTGTGWHDGYLNGHRNGYHSGYADGWRDARYATWVPWSKVGTDNVANHAVAHAVATRGVPRSSVIATVAPPKRLEVERRTGRPVPEARVVERTASIDGRAVTVVRPTGQTEHVRRHGADTVERALAPAARERSRTEVARRSVPARTKNLRVGGADTTARSTDRYRPSTTRESPTRTRAGSRTPPGRAPESRVFQAPDRSRADRVTSNERASRHGPGSAPSARTEAGQQHNAAMKRQRSTVRSLPASSAARTSGRPPTVTRTRGGASASAPSASRGSAGRPKGSVRSSERHRPATASAEPGSRQRGQPSQASERGRQRDRN